MNILYNRDAVYASDLAPVRSMIRATAEVIIKRSEITFAPDEQQTICDLIARRIATETTSDIESFARWVIGNEFRSANAKKLIGEIINEESSTDAGGNGRRHPASWDITKNQSLIDFEGEVDQSDAEFEQVTPSDAGIDSILYPLDKGEKTLNQYRRHSASLRDTSNAIADPMVSDLVLVEKQDFRSDDELRDDAEANFDDNEFEQVTPSDAGIDSILYPLDKGEKTLNQYRRHSASLRDTSNAIANPMVYDSVLFEKQDLLSDDELRGDADANFDDDDPELIQPVTPGDADHHHWR